jgi:4-amino-4-deoxy-L-arabinose transferase-like glycosyltransferase
MVRPSQLRAAHLRLAASLLLLASVPLFTLCYGSRAPWTLEVGTPGDHRYLHGFLPPIVGDRASYRWSGPDAELRLHGWVGRGARIELRLDGGAAAPPRRLLLVQPRDNAVLASLTVSSGWNAYPILLPRSTLGDADVLGPKRLALRAERYRTAPDGSALGFKLALARIEPLAIDWPVAVARSAMLTWALSLSFALGLCLIAHLPAGSQPIARLAALAALAATIAVVALALLRFPQVTAWALPPLPVICALLTLPYAWRWLHPHVHDVRAGLLPRLPTGAAIAALLVALAALGLLYVRISTWWTLSLAAIAVVALFVLVAPREAREETGEVPAPTRPALRALVLTAALVVVTAFTLRFYRVSELPFGMWRDEARHGLAALKIIEDPHYRPVFLPAADIPAGGAYAFVPAFLLFGIRTWTMRIVTALAGALTVVPLAFVARRLTGRWDTALLAAGLLAGSAWHLTISRLSFMSVFDPLCELSALALCAHALNPRQPPLRRALWLALAGALLGLAVHTYHAGRLAPLVGLGFVLCLAGRSLLTWRGLATLAPAVAAFAVVVAPLALYALRSPQTANARVERVSLVSDALHNGVAPLAALDASFGRHLLMLHARGDTIGRHNLPGQPQLDPFTGLGLLAGLIVLARRLRDPRTLFLLGAMTLGIVPSLLSVDGPRVTRALNVLPYACIVSAVGWSLLLVPACIGERRRAWMPAALTLAAALCASWSYYVAAPRDEAVWRAFYPIETKAGEYLRALAEHEGANVLARTYVPVALAKQEVTQYLAHGLRFGVYDDQALRPAPSGTFRVLVPAASDLAVPMRLAATLGRHQSAAIAGSLLPDGVTPAFAVLQFD